jgi:hypothetical protein
MWRDQFADAAGAVGGLNLKLDGHFGIVDECIGTGALASTAATKFAATLRSDLKDGLPQRLNALRRPSRQPRHNWCELMLALRL